MTTSIVIPTFNRAHLISRAIESVLEQTDGDWELIIVDDGSTDNTEDVVGRFTHDQRIKYIKKENSGAAESRNLGVAQATGTLITFLDSDDELKKNWLEDMKKVLVEQSAAAVCCGLERFNQKGESLSIEMPYSMEPMFENMRGRFTNGGVYLMYRDIFQAVGGFDPLLQSGQHTEMSLRLVPYLIRSGKSVVNIMEPLVRVHIHDGPRIRYNYSAIFEGSSRTLMKHKVLLKKDKRQYINYLSVAGVCGVRTKRYREARGFFFEAVRAKPQKPQLWFRWIISHLPYLRDVVWKKDTKIN